MERNKTTCYRVQPKDKSIDGWKSLTSNDEHDLGPHVFGSVSELAHGVQWWGREKGQFEILEIECDTKALRDNGDVEGYVLVGKGTVVSRKLFKTWAALISWAKTDPETL